jgi:hypothetical protein
MTAKVGTIVVSRHTPEGTLHVNGLIGVCFNDYATGSQFIFSNGDYDGFSEEEQNTMLEVLGIEESSAGYKSTNIMSVNDGYRIGYWNEAFAKWRKLIPPRIVSGAVWKAEVEER